MNFAYNNDFKVDDFNFIFSNSTKTIELIDINIKANLKRNYELKGSIVNYNEFRSHKLLYKRIPKEKVSLPIYYVCETKNFSKQGLEQILNYHSDKKLISILFDYLDDCSDRSKILLIDRYPLFNIRKEM